MEAVKFSRETKRGPNLLRGTANFRKSEGKQRGKGEKGNLKNEHAQKEI